MLEIDGLGLDSDDRRVLECIINKFRGGPVGLDTLSAATGEEDVTIEDVIEPFLIQLGFIARTPRGRWRCRPLTDILAYLMKRKSKEGILYCRNLVRTCLTMSSPRNL